MNLGDVLIGFGIGVVSMLMGVAVYWLVGDEKDTWLTRREPTDPTICHHTTRRACLLKVLRRIK